jgi:hypothetical protein
VFRTDFGKEHEGEGAVDKDVVYHRARSHQLKQRPHLREKKKELSEMLIDKRERDAHSPAAATSTPAKRQK